MNSKFFSDAPIESNNSFWMLRDGVATICDILDIVCLSSSFSKHCTLVEKGDPWEFKSQIQNFGLSEKHGASSLKSFSFSFQHQKENSSKYIFSDWVD